LELWADLHTHTKFSHGRGSMVDNVRQAASRGLKAVGITDHGPASLLIGVNPRLMPIIKAERERCRRLFPEVQVLLGIEANVISLDGEIDLPPGWENELDYVLLGLHPRVRPRHFKMGLLLFANFLYRNLRFLFTSSWKTRLREANTRVLSLAVERYPVLAVTHPGYGLPVDTATLVAHCRARGTALEINCNHVLKTTEFIKAACDAGAWFIISSDAHLPDKVGDLHAGEEVAQKLAIPPERIINASPSTSVQAGTDPVKAELLTGRGKVHA